MHLAVCVIAALGQPVAHTAPDGPAAVLRFEVRDQAGEPIPCRLTLRTNDDPRPMLFPNTDVEPNRLAVRRNTVYAIDGRGVITVPPGDYTLWITHGLEYSIEKHELSLAADETYEVTARLRHEVDTTGWISGDFHLHTLTYSGHGDSNLPERIISLIGEQVEFAVATDHNHHTDYQPTIEEVGGADAISAVIGNEVSTSVGHFIAFPLETGPVIPFRLPSAQPLFSIIRETPNAYDVVPVIQLNHPRWAEINYFDQAGLDPVTGRAESDVWSDDFDTIEILNENAGWGYFEPDLTDLHTGTQTFSVLRDWFNLLNNGHRSAAVGNSDSHTVESNVAGYPRNYVRSDAPDPASIDPAQICEALKSNQVFTTLGPFVHFEVNGAPMGATLTLDDAEAHVQIRVQAASWIDCDRVKVVVNGDVVHTIDVPDARSVERLNTTWSFSPQADCWVSLLVEGDDPLTDIVHDKGRPIFPIAVTNLVWIDADADGAWTSPAEQAAAQVNDVTIAEITTLPPAQRALMVDAAALHAAPHAAEIVRELLDDHERHVRLAAADAARRLADPTLAPALAAALAEAGADEHQRVLLLFALHAAGDDRASDGALELLQTSGARLMQRFGDRIHDLLPEGRFIREWTAVGCFDASDGAIDVEFGPETDDDAVRVYAGLNGPAKWTPIDADENGYVDLTRVSPSHDQAVAYLRCIIESDAARDVHYTFGADDGSRVYLNGELIYEENGAHGADPLQHVGVLHLRKGANLLLVKVRNGAGDFGAFLRVLDEHIALRR